ncbi:[cytidine(C)-cytidine(C)-adenosine (A)]-adding enzyme [Leptospira gomenensis]|uniref:[cytidine(C)-cytidine(C)-adenosine (A)]-adding enzyme n=1 Tax=Leptospira gomenensis TaxID=2484974 RepID=A0A5F1Z0P3_9LEPT|nr:[cytidine(C)-cytidine(C)-adenosine (A)]-adding enzyme [Leptospira gomenensis]TGK35508.1 [cytidine(C)-cytidine(C)-adenosine (A)]-adding enzyme [Leptospira gomenensis]TGK40600.1 [cytidine(C)-cytidine(C)-adenosine (A)]-adding enzyme [Leptospira gomenensis]TGK46278.1 [cytidine(C)-cytidine(C)-adenosine (A)]-adding enzyme [Leptospira gomenensis]TGK65537.1 [cytidine(C)-cytidine(C)-adenosine (A)]-adding enzyme [Leptospira gomenensis]
MTERNAGAWIENIPEPFREEIGIITETITKHGGECYVVGGAVRDLVLGKTPDEFDLTTSLLPETILGLFKRTVPTGIKHGTVTVLFQDRAYEVTTFRKDADYLDGRRPETVEFGVSLSEDLKRRDFTMNALALDLKTKKLTDEHGGLEDIERKLIRTIGDPIGRFTEDGLRPIRGIRFVSSLGFTLESKTEAAIRICKNVTAKVSKERVHDELNKILKCPDPSPSLLLFRDFEILELFTELPPNVNPDQTILSRIREIPTSPLGLRLSFLHEWLFGMFAVNETSKRFFKDLRYSNQNTKDALFFSGMLDSVREKLRSPTVVTDAEIRRLILHPICMHAGRENLGRLAAHVFLLVSKRFPEIGSHISSERLQELSSRPDALLVTELAVRGEDILRNFPSLPSKEIGRILQTLLRLVLEHPEQNRKEILLSLVSVGSFGPDIPGITETS